MEVTELRIGNILTVDKTPVIITSLDDEGNIGFQLKHNGKIEKNTTKPFLMEPIPLTDELFKQLGFDEVNGSYWVKNGIAFIEEEPGEFRASTGIGMYSFGICVMFLHQLQNLFFVHNGQELETLLA